MVGHTEQVSDTLVDLWSTRPVLVTTEQLPQWLHDLRTAAQNAARRGVAVVVLSTLQRGDGPASEYFASALAVLRKSKPRVQVRVIPSRPDGSELLGLSEAAGLVVMSATTPRISALVMDVGCPVVVVPDREQPDEGPVVIGVAPWTAEIVLEAGFREAAMRGVPVEAVRIWSDRLDDLARPNPPDPDTGGALAHRLRRETDLAVSFFAGRYPSVEVHQIMVEGQTVPELRRCAERAQLLVLGRSVRGLDLARLVGSPIEDLIRGAGCPVMVVPGDGCRARPGTRRPRRVQIPSRWSSLCS